MAGRRSRWADLMGPAYQPITGIISKYIWPNDTSKRADRVVNLYEDSRGNIWFYPQ